MKRGRTTKKEITKEEKIAKEARAVVKKSTNAIATKVARKKEFVPEKFHQNIEDFEAVKDSFANARESLDKAKTALADTLSKALADNEEGFDEDIVKLIRLRDEGKEQLDSIEATKKRKTELQNVAATFLEKGLTPEDLFEFIKSRKQNDEPTQTQAPPRAQQPINLKASTRALVIDEDEHSQSCLSSSSEEC